MFYFERKREEELQKEIEEEKRKFQEKMLQKQTEEMKKRLVEINKRFEKPAPDDSKQRENLQKTIQDIVAGSKKTIEQKMSPEELKRRRQLEATKKRLRELNSGTDKDNSNNTQKRKLAETWKLENINKKKRKVKHNVKQKEFRSNDLDFLNILIILFPV